MNEEDDDSYDEFPFVEVAESALYDFDYLAKFGSHHYWRHTKSVQIAVSSDDDDSEQTIVDPRRTKKGYVWLDTKAIKNNPPIDHAFVNTDILPTGIPVYDDRTKQKSMIDGTMSEYEFAHFLSRHGQSLRGAYYGKRDSGWRPTRPEKARNVERTAGNCGRR